MKDPTKYLEAIKAIDNEVQEYQSLCRDLIEQRRLLWKELTSDIKVDGDVDVGGLIADLHL